MFEARTYINTHGIDNDKKLLCVAVYLVGERSKAEKAVKKNVKDPRWKQRLDRNIKKITYVWHRGELHKDKEVLINRAYKIRNKRFKTVIENIKQRLTEKSQRVRRCITRQKQFEQNRLFTVNQNVFFQSLTDNGVKYTPTDSVEATTFWPDLWGAPVVHN